MPPSRVGPAPEQRPAASSGPLLGTWSLSHPAELSEVRGAVAACVDGSVGPMTTGGRLLLLVVSELATNGLKYGSPPLVVSLYRTDEGWLVDVRDGRGDCPPVLNRPAPASPGGHGLRIVEHVSTTWGWYRAVTGAPGKHVWAHVPATSSP